MIRPDSYMGEQLSGLGVKGDVRSKRKILPVIRAVHEIKKEDFSMKVLDHNYYVQEKWEDYKDLDESFISMICRKISNILH